MDISEKKTVNADKKTSFRKKILCFEEIRVKEPKIEKNRVRIKVLLKKLDEDAPQANKSAGNREKKRDENRESDNVFELIFTYPSAYSSDKLKDFIPVFRMLGCMPLMNYSLFTQRLTLEFPLSNADISLLKDFSKIFARDIFINKFVRRRTNYILPEYIPQEDEITELNASPQAEIMPSGVYDDVVLTLSEPEKYSCAVLSSGGKESLLTYGMLKEISNKIHDVKVWPMYIAESGGHWKTALTAYRWHIENDPNTIKVWTNIDRFYLFMLDNLKFIRKDHRRVRADTYPIRLCIFPVYIFSLLPLIGIHRIGNVLLGSEFDDPRTEAVYNGIRHYWGVYDQHKDHDLRMEEWYKARMPGIRQWSAVRPISGLVVERILVSRYPHLGSLQRSCHSCHIEMEEQRGKKHKPLPEKMKSSGSKKGVVVPCGRCSKCLGILLFLLSNGADPKLMGFQKSHIDQFFSQFRSELLRLDADEKEHALYLIKKRSEESGKDKDICIYDSKHLKNLPDGKKHEHIETIHNHESVALSLMPAQFNSPITAIIEQYTKGYSLLQKDNWVKKKTYQ
ncbi:MAG: hypothetical protein QW728_06610 [Thermoplasmata archaeon]